MLAKRMHRTFGPAQAEDRARSPAEDARGLPAGPPGALQPAPNAWSASAAASSFEHREDRDRQELKNRQAFNYGNFKFNNSQSITFP